MNRYAGNDAPIVEPKVITDVPVSHNYSIRRSLRVWRSRVIQAWQSLQVSRSGRYSVERMLALDEYTRTTSLFRAVFVCIVAPIPMIAIVLIQESIPLASPQETWHANYGVWARMAILGAAVACTIVLEMQHRIEGVQISVGQLLVLALSMSVAYSAIGISLAIAWVFPVPFIALFISSPGAIVFVILLRLVCGPRTWQKVVRKPELVIRLMLFLSAQATTALVYQAYSAAFRVASNTHFELPLIFVLPIIKLVVKNVVARIVSHLEDLIPESVMFTVELFNTIYTAMCLQITPSLLTMSTILVLDVFHTVHALHGLHKHTKNSLRQIQYIGDGILVEPSLLGVASMACHQQTNYKTNICRRQTRLQSCTRHKLSSSQVALLDSLKSMLMFAGPSVENRMVKEPNGGLILPRSPTEDSKNVKAEGKALTPDATPKIIMTNPTKVLEDALDALFTSECLVIAEYLETIIPIVYGVYLLLMVHLPVAKYHGELDGIANSNSNSKLGMVFVYGLLEMASFIMFATVLRRNCRLSALYHLAFVLETHTAAIQIS